MVQISKISNVTALVEYVTKVNGNVTVSIESDNQRSFKIYGDLNNVEFAEIVNDISNCLSLFNVSGHTAYVDVARTQDSDFLEGLEIEEDINNDSLGRLQVRGTWWTLFFDSQPC